MPAFDAEPVAVMPVAVLPSELRYSTLSVEVHKQNHLAMGMSGERYLVVHPKYSLSPRSYSLRMLGAVLLVLLEVTLFLFVLLGLCTPFFRVGEHGYFAFDGGSGGSASHTPERRRSLVICSALIVVYLFTFSFICPILLARCVSHDQQARVSEELFNRELLEQHGAQVHEDGRVYGPGGEPSLVKEEGLWGPCCGFEANERARRSKSARIVYAQCVVVLISLVLQSFIVSDMKWVYTIALVKRKNTTHGRGFRITVFALVLRTFEFLLYCCISIGVLCHRCCRQMPCCQLIPLSGSRAAGALSTSGGVYVDRVSLKGDVEDGYPEKPPNIATDREGGREMETLPMRKAP
ncbi:hypothetical protein LSCM4_04272 [Leishmania orientalis]|uniref:Uncharacterized protein n=1 Tax=Leishmania orientalis TaxID=2249476 RepID=A0A836KRM4_9TRYP|nr:hypothetical protein LSCM4_04272 [Leishmania orientalis]